MTALAYYQAEAARLAAELEAANRTIAEQRVVIEMREAELTKERERTAGILGAEARP